MGCIISDRSEVFTKKNSFSHRLRSMNSLGSIPFAGPVKNSQGNSARGVIDARVPGFLSRMMKNDWKGQPR